MKKVLTIFTGFVILLAASSIGLFLLRDRKVNDVKNEIQIGDVTVEVTISETPQERMKGLSGRQSLSENEGMLFIFEQKDTTPTFWMKEMLTPLDIIWIDEEQIVQINKDVPIPQPGTQDQNLTLYPANQPIDYVLEVNAGFSEKNNIKVGDSVVISAEGYSIGN